MKRAVFLDRDGVINRPLIRNGRPYAPRVAEDFEILPGVEAAVKALRAAGFELIVVTNQPDVARGSVTREVVEAMHERLRQLLPVDDILVCYHDDADRCACRKPRPGMLYAAAATHDIALSRSFLVGDRWRDIEAGRAAGCSTVLVRSGHDEPVKAAPDAVAENLLDASRWILTA